MTGFVAKKFDGSLNKVRKSVEKIMPIIIGNVVGDVLKLNI